MITQLPKPNQWKYFCFRSIHEAELWVKRGGIAVHHTGFPFRKWRFTAHLFAIDTQTLYYAIRCSGADPKWIQYPGTHREHYDLFGKPLENALELCGLPCTFSPYEGV